MNHIYLWRTSFFVNCSVCYHSKHLGAYSINFFLDVFHQDPCTATIDHCGVSYLLEVLQMLMSSFLYSPNCPHMMLHMYVAVTSWSPSPAIYASCRHFPTPPFWFSPYWEFSGILQPSFLLQFCWQRFFFSTVSYTIHPGVSSDHGSLQTSSHTFHKQTSVIFPVVTFSHPLQW